ncbi:MULTISPECIES: multidrug efflux SMR transporter [Halorussus]|uniref:DMT family transporter n=1 Tax=Halorussus TaxID=1070314 RepID=UPI000E21B2D3|nr:MULTISPECIES: multidrug efflux SMR transporter [Halorussus]NHN60902.1 multidrug efflux SMR transporter [Halorussus sp. JP-T4]
MRAYLYLAAAIAAEVAGTTALKFSDGFENLLPTAVVLVGYIGSFYLLSLVLQDLPVGLVYATWSAVGIVAAALVGVVLFDESVDAAALAGMALIVAGVLVLNLLSESYSPAH